MTAQKSLFPSFFQINVVYTSVGAGLPAFSTINENRYPMPLRVCSVLYLRRPIFDLRVGLSWCHEICLRPQLW